MHRYYDPYRDPYRVLGLPVTADVAEIKKVFRNLAKHLHPDVNPNDPHATARFQQVKIAYETLIQLKTAPQPQYYPPYPPVYPYYQAPPSPQAPPQAKAQENDFQAYAWEPIEIKEEDIQAPKPKERPFTPPKVEDVPEPDYSDSPWREDLLQLAVEESFRQAKDRVSRKKYAPEEQLTQEILVYLLRGKTAGTVSRSHSRHSSNNKS